MSSTLKGAHLHKLLQAHLAKTHKVVPIVARSKPKPLSSDPSKTTCVRSYMRKTCDGKDVRVSEHKKRKRSTSPDDTVTERVSKKLKTLGK